MDTLLFALIIAGVGLSGAYLRAEFLLRRRNKAAERREDLSLHELHANRLRPKQIDVPVAALRNHQHFISKESAICAQAETPSTVYSRKSTDIGIARHREPA
jgi:hypothetical protein